MWGGGGVDFVDYQSSTTPVTVDLKGRKGKSKTEGSDKLSEIENAYGSPFDDKLTGDLGRTRSPASRATTRLTAAAARTTCSVRTATTGSAAASATTR